MDVELVVCRPLVLQMQRILGCSVCCPQHRAAGCASSLLACCTALGPQPCSPRCPGPAMPTTFSLQHTMHHPSSAFPKDLWQNTKREGLFNATDCQHSFLMRGILKYVPAKNNNAIYTDTTLPSDRKNPAASWWEMWTQLFWSRRSRET